MIALLSHNGRCCIGINSDTAAVTEPELLVDCLREGRPRCWPLRGSRPVSPAAVRKPARKSSSTRKSR